MSDSEIGYWQAVVDDQRVANERTSEALAEARTELAQLRHIVAVVALHIQQIKENDTRMHDTFVEAKRLINEYLESKTP